MAVKLYEKCDHMLLYINDSTGTQQNLSWHPSVGDSVSHAC